jgi:Tol biopolymer transport system component
MARAKMAIVASVLSTAAVLSMFAWAGTAQARVIERVSLATDGTVGNDDSYQPCISADGRFVAFVSDASNLVAGDTNGIADLFVRDLQTGATTRVNLDSGGNQADKGPNYDACMSADGRFVAFTSDATNLVAGDTNGCPDVFVHDRVTGVTTRESVSGSGAQGLDGYSDLPSISADGRYVAFDSDAANLVAGDNNGCNDVFVRDRQTGATTRVSVRSNGTQGNGLSYWPSISATGRYVSFTSYASNLVSGDTNDIADVFVRDLQTGATTRVSVATGGAQGNDLEGGHENTGSSISADGRYVAFQSMAWGLVSPGSVADYTYIYVHDRQTGATTCASVGTDGSQGNGGSYYPSISSDGRYVVFNSQASNLVTGDTNRCTDVFVYDRQTGTTTRISTADDGTQGDGHSFALFGSLSSDGQLVALYSRATNLVAGDSNKSDDVFTVLLGTRIPCSTIRGSDRYDTAIRISKAMFPSALSADSGLVVAPGYTFQEALCGAPLAAAWGGPVLLTDKAALFGNVKAELQRLAPTRVFCIGLSTNALNGVKTALPGVTVTAINGTGTGADAICDMSRKVANALAAKVGDMSGATAILTIGTNFPDAIGVAPLACAKLWPIILTDKAAGPTEPPLHASAIGALSDLVITKALRVGTYAKFPPGVTRVGSCSGVNRYATNVMVADWATANAGLTFAHTGIATGDKFPDALASGPYLAKDGGILLLSPLLGPLQPVTGALISANRSAVQRVTFIAMVEPVIGQVKALLP